MINFQHYNPTRIIFGKDVYKNIGEEVKKYGTRILMVYGGKSLKANGTYDKVVKSLKKAGVKFSELSGIKPNPRLTPVYEGIKIAREKKVEMILAVGGGSVITTCCTDLFYPKFAMLDPQLCYTLPDHQISAGGTDILAHVMERYFVPDDNHEFSDRMCEAAMISLIHNLPKVLADKKNYDAWAEVMWIGNVAHNGLLARGKRDDWGSHDIEHQLSAHYDIAHGAGLAIIFPAWMKYVWKEKPSMMEQYAVRVWGVSTEGKCLMRKQIKWFPESRFTGIQEIILRLLILCRSCSQERRQLSQRAAWNTVNSLLRTSLQMQECTPMI
mgnify:CR=1 FL=1